MSREQLVEMAKINMAHGDAGTIPQTDDVLKVPVENYFDTERWQQEMSKIFKRIPLMLAMTSELKEPGDYKAMDAGGVPVLISRTEGGEVKAFVNMCAHRGGLAHGLEHGRVGVPEQQRAVPHEEVDVLVTVDVPLPAALAVRHVHRDRREEPQVVAGAASEHLRRGPCNLSQSALLFCCRP